MNLSRSMSSSNSARRVPRSRRRKVISASSAPTTEKRMESRALGSTRCVEQMVSRLGMERSGSRTGTRTAVPFLWLSNGADGDPKIISVGLYETVGRFPTSR